MRAAGTEAYRRSRCHRDPCACGVQQARGRGRRYAGWPAASAPAPRNANRSGGRCPAPALAGAAPAAHLGYIGAFWQAGQPCPGGRPHSNRAADGRAAAARSRAAVQGRAAVLAGQVRLRGRGGCRRRRVGSVEAGGRGKTGGGGRRTSGGQLAGHVWRSCKAAPAQQQASTLETQVMGRIRGGGDGESTGKRAAGAPRPASRQAWELGGRAVEPPRPLPRTRLGARRPRLQGQLPRLRGPT